jgi:uncharacterized membrane protein YgcG
MASAAVVGSVLLALIEGMGIWMNNYFSQMPNDPNMIQPDMGPPENDITAPPTSGGVGMMPTGLTLKRAGTAKQSSSSADGMMMMEGESERFDSGGHETTFSSGGGSGSSGAGGEKSGGWWPFGSS